MITYLYDVVKIELYEYEPGNISIINSFQTLKEAFKLKDKLELKQSECESYEIIIRKP